MLCILSALESEIATLRANLDSCLDTDYAAKSFVSGVLDGTPVVIAHSGVGKVNTAMTTQLAIDHYDVDNIILLGLGGGIGPEVTIGDIVISEDVVQHDFDATGLTEVQIGEIPFSGVGFLHADRRLIRIARQAANRVIKAYGQTRKIQNRRYCPRVIKGRVMTGDQFICDVDKVNWLWETFKGHCVEMEGASMAQCAYLNSKPFVIIRGISDKCGADAGDSFMESLQSVIPQFLVDVAVDMIKMLSRDTN